MHDAIITASAPAAAAPAAPTETPQVSAAPVAASTQPAATATATAAPATASTPAAAAPTDSQPTSIGTEPQKPQEIVANDVKLVIDPVTGKRHIEDVAAPAAQPQPAQEAQPQVIPGSQDPNAIPSSIKPQSNGEGESGTTGLTSNFLNQAQRSNEYTEPELYDAIQNNRVDESRIPDIYKPQYTAYKQKRFEDALNKQMPTGNTGENAKQAAIEANRKFYERVNDMAKKQAMEQIGITEEELDAAEYTDDKDLINKAQLYEAALQNAQGTILSQTRQRVMDQQRAAQTRESKRAEVINGIVSFVDNARKTEPNFAAIDAMLQTRYRQMPYEQAAEIAKVIDDANHGKIDEAGAEKLRQYYEDTRKAYYAQASNVGTVPTHISRPPAVETPGVGNNNASQRPDPRQLRHMTYQQKQKWFQAYFK